MTNEITDDEIERQSRLLRTDPEAFLELTNSLVEQHPNDANAYFRSPSGLGAPRPITLGFG